LWVPTRLPADILHPAVMAMRTFAIDGKLSAKQASLVLWTLAIFKHRSRAVRKTLPELGKVILQEVLCLVQALCKPAHSSLDNMCPSFPFLRCRYKNTRLMLSLFRLAVMGLDVCCNICVGACLR
jgi:hypothetical protein